MGAPIKADCEGTSDLGGAANVDFIPAWRGLAIACAFLNTFRNKDRSRAGLVARKRRSVPSEADDPRAQRSLVALQNALLHLIEYKELDQITIEDITREAGLSYPTFFRRCRSKHELLNRIATREVKEALQRSRATMDNKELTASSIPMLTYIQSKRKIWKTLLTGGASSAMREEFMRIAETIAESRDRVKPWIPVDLAISVSASGIFEILTWWMNQPEDFPVEEVSSLYETLAVAPLMKN